MGGPPTEARAPRPMRLPRFHVLSLASGEGLIELPEDAAHHALHVLRLKPGSSLRIFDGAGHEAEAQIETIRRHQVLVRVGGRISPCPEAGLRIVLAAAPLRGDLFDLVIQKGTEMGVAAFWPVVTAHTEPGGRAAIAGTRLDRWRKIASSAAAQCGRAMVPAIEPPAPLAAVLDRPFDGLRLLFDESATGRSALPLTPSPPRSTLLLVGPAGGFAPEELREATERRGCLSVSLGPRVLRAETAALVAIAAVQVLWGDLQPAPRSL
jgi:16S rRNA (uracil1498-N3)-methyltransferase